MGVIRTPRPRVGWLASAVVALVIVTSAIGVGVIPAASSGPDTPRSDAAGPPYRPDGVVSERLPPGEQGSKEVRQATPTNDTAQFEIVEVSSDVDVGESGTLTVAIRNVGDQLVRNATVTLSSTSSDVRFAPGGEQTTVSAGAIEPGEVVRVPVGVTVSPSAEQRRYVVDVTINYRPDGSDSRQTRTLLAEFTPGATQDLDIRAENSSLYVDESGTLRGRLENDGNQDIENAIVVLEGARNQTGLIQVPDNSVVVGDVTAGQSEPFSFEVDVGPAVEPGPRQFQFHVIYEEEDGTDRRQRSPTIYEEWPIQERRDRFSLQEVESTLRVDESGEVSGQLVYAGNEPAEDAVLVLQGPGGNVSSSLSIVEREYALGDLESGDRANFSFDVDASAEASSGPRQFTFRVQYVDENGVTTRSDPLYARVGVGEERDRFRVEPIDASLDAGSTGPVRLRVTNVGGEPLTDISVKLFVDDPLTAEDSEAFVSRLEPNESATLLFRASVAGSAQAKEYPLSVDFEYTDEDGDTQLSKTYRVGLTVQPGEDGGILPFAVAGLLFVTLAAVAVGVRH